MSAAAVTLPFVPKAMLHKFSGTIVKVHSIGHSRGRRLKGGRSQDLWWYECDVRFQNGPTTRLEVAPYQLCADTPEGHAEINALSDLLSNYLAKHGKWTDRGWFAHDKRSATP